MIASSNAFSPATSNWWIWHLNLFLVILHDSFQIVFYFIYELFINLFDFIIRGVSRCRLYLWIYLEWSTGTLLIFCPFGFLEDRGFREEIIFVTSKNSEWLSCDYIRFSIIQQTAVANIWFSALFNPRFLDHFFKGSKFWFINLDSLHPLTCY